MMKSDSLKTAVVEKFVFWNAHFPGVLSIISADLDTVSELLYSEH